ncbi:hypothetical protein GKR48_14515 [Providencia sp. wls1943]|nr:hypothetical protein CYG50_03460 [Providencia huaxiensis]MTB68018.1 hypothetical protein [Providencia sp. wls1943]
MMSIARKGDAQICGPGVGVAKNICGVISMSSLNQIRAKKQFRCLPASKSGPFQYVEIITSADASGNYQTEQQLVDIAELRNDWANFYFNSKGEAHV